MTLNIKISKNNLQIYINNLKHYSLKTEKNTKL